MKRAQLIFINLNLKAPQLYLFENTELQNLEILTTFSK
jgi:hypothetical protein